MKRLRNTTPIPAWLVKEVEQFVMPPGGVGAYDLELRNTDGLWGGRAYMNGSAYHTTNRRFVVVRVGSWRSPNIEQHGNGYLPMPAMANRLEILVFILAHELRHLWQRRVPKSRRVWGARGQFSERDADAWALHCLRRWRREVLTNWAWA